MVQQVYGFEVFGVGVDAETRCVHYHTAVDIVAIKFHCCGKYYPCFECHGELAGHAATVWPKAAFEEKAILCGACGTALSVAAYLESNNRCPQCDSAFNANCKFHYHRYFET